MISVLHHDETETGPRLRKTLIDKWGITPALVRGKIGGVITSNYLDVDVDLYTYHRNSDGQQLWFVEAMIYEPPDAIIWRSYLLESEPDDAEIIEIVATDRKVSD